MLMRRRQFIPSGIFVTSAAFSISTMVWILPVLVMIAIGIITYFKWAFTYWKRRCVPYLPPSFPFGNIDSPIAQKEHIGIKLIECYKELKARGHKHAGLYFMSTPIYMPIDLEHVTNVMSRDFSHFMDHGHYYNERDDPMSAHLFNIEGEKWKNLRVKLTPAFTSSKIKSMFQTMTACGDQLTSAMEEMEMRNEAVQIKDVFRSFTIDIIDSCAFGLDCNSFKEPNGEFQKCGRMIFSTSKEIKFKYMIANASAKLARAMGISLIDKEVSDFFMRIVKDTVEFREKTNFRRKDFMQVLIDLKNEDQDCQNLTIEQIAAQAMLFFTAGFETSSTTMTFCLYEIARNKAIQRRVRDEIEVVLAKYDGEVCYEAIADMKYLNQVLEETLRLYPPTALLLRVCVKDYEVPKTNVIIEKGTKVFIPTYALQHDPEFFPEPERFDPDRFNEENRKNIRSFTYMPFGEGPRICIGLRFALVEMKVGLASLLKRFKFSINPKTRDPLVLKVEKFITADKGGIWFDVEKI